MKHRDNSHMADRLRYFRDISVNEDERLGQREYYVGKHRDDSAVAWLRNKVMGGGCR